MIDAVRLGTPVDNPTRVAARLSNAEETIPTAPEGIPMVRGYLGTLRVTLKADRLILRGSLPTYMGHTAPLSRPLVALARERIEDELGEDLGSAHVWGLELTADLPLPRPVRAYFPLLYSSPRLQRVEYGGESVAFAVKSRRLTFYDKAAECRKRKKPVPPGNVLRLELQFRRRLSRQVDAAGALTFAELHGAYWWERLIGHWRDAYESVEKIHAPLAFDAIGDVRRALSLVGLGVVGRATAEAAIRSDMDLGIIGRSAGYSRMKWIRDLESDPALTAVDERITELDNAVRTATDNALRHC